MDHLVAQGFGAFNTIRTGPWVSTEDGPLHPDFVGAQAMPDALHHLEDVVAKACGTGIVWARGHRRPGHAGAPAPLPAGRGGTGCRSWLHLDDAAGATVLAVEQRAHGVFNIVDDEPAPVSKWLPHLAQCAGAKRPMRLPVWLARLVAGDMAVMMMTEACGFSNAKAKRELGWSPRYRSWREGFVEALGFKEAPA